MDSILNSKEVIFAFFGVFLSVIFSQNLYRKVISFVIGFADSAIPFEHQLKNGSNDKLTKKQITKIHSLNVARAKKLQSVEKSLVCNISVAMTLLVVVGSATSFRLIGADIRSIEVTWGLLLTLVFVYLSYFLWSRFRDKDYWSSMPAMTASRYGVLLTISGTAAAWFMLLWARGIYDNWLFFVSMTLFIFGIIHLQRVPHINNTHRAAVAFEEDENFYMRDVGKELSVVMATFITLSLVHLMMFDWIKANSKLQYIDIHPVRAFLILFSIPFIVFAVKFFRLVGFRPVLNVLLYIPLQFLEKRRI